MFKKVFCTIAVVGVVYALALGVGRADASPQSVGAQEIQDLLRSRSPAVFLLDVRTPAEYQRGRIPGSVLIPMNTIPSRLSDIPKDKRVVVVCASGGRSAVVARYLRESGYPWVANYAGGVIDWQRRGLPLER